MDIDKRKKVSIFIIILISFFSFAYGITNPNDFKVINDFRNGLDNPELLEWPSKGSDPCGPPAWPHVFCSNGRVTQIQIQGLGLKGTLPSSLNRLEMLENVGFQKNMFSGKLPSFSGLSNLQYVYLDFNNFDTIPSDFFNGLSSVRVLALDNNPFNESSGWSIPSDLQESTQLTNFSCSSCNVVGPLPDFLGNLPSLSLLRMSYNRLSGELPSSFKDSMLQILWLNDQDGGGITGSIDVIGSMVGLTQVWLHGNGFTGSIPDSIGSLTSLQELNLNGNQLVGLIPPALADMNLRLLNLNNNMFMGPIPKFKSANGSYDSNSFCQADPGEQCAPEVNALLDFLHELNYPPNLASKWIGNDPCEGPWWGISCNPNHNVSIINLQKLKLNGTLSRSLVNLNSLLEIHLNGNNLHGPVPANLTQLRFLRLLDLTGNNIEPPLPRFHSGVKVVIDGNPKLFVKEPPSNATSPSSASPVASPSGSRRNSSLPIDDQAPSSEGSSSKSHQFNYREEPHKPENSSNSKLVVVVAVAAGVTLGTILAFLVICYVVKKRKEAEKPPGGIVVHPKDSSDGNDMVKIAVSDDASTDVYTVGDVESKYSEGSGILENGNLVISVQVLRKVTNNFARENELGRGGFGVVYKGELDDGTEIAVKRMEAGVVCNKALDEFQAEIAVLSKVRHRHLVSLLGYSVEGNERLLVYEYMPQGALSRHLFRWKSLNLEPLSWTKRLIIALDVARGMEYLHSLAHHSFIHRDLKSSNIILSDEFRAKVADFGLVKLAPDRERSMATRLAGTFGYLAPEYAVTGKITTKVDVFSFGVVLMELLTGLTALDEQRPEESRYLAEYFWQIKSDKEKLLASIDPALDDTEDTFDSIYAIAELAGHCTSRDPNHRPEMGYAVNVLAQLVEKWKPFEETEDYSGITFAPLSEMLKDWKETDSKDSSSTSQDSKGSIPAKPAGFADSFTSADAR